MKNQLNIGIIGAGIAGLASALALLKEGYRVTVFEKNTELKELGAGIQLSPNATRILNDWHLLNLIQTQAVAPSGVRFMHWQSGKVLADFPLNQKTQQSPYLHIHRADLYQCLVNAIEAHKNLTLRLAETVVEINAFETHCSIRSKTIHNEIADVNFDYVIGADGVHSLCRELIAPNAPANFTGNVAWRGIIPIKKLPKHFEKKAHLVMAPAAHLVFYYIKGGEFLNYVAIKEHSNFKNESWTEKGSIENLLQDFSAWHEDFLNILKQSDTDNLYRWALYDREPLNSWHKGRCIILGDAAHPVLPYLAQGAAMALEDAQCLAFCFAEALKNNTEHKFGEHFYSLRAERCTQVLMASRANRQLYHENNRIKREIRDLGSRIFTRIYPEFLNKKLNWLYSYQLKK